MRKGPELDSKTDVIPIINVSLVVVLTLMIISPALNQDQHDVNLPQARASETEEENKVEITYTLDGEIFFGDESIELSEVTPILAGVLVDNPEVIAVIRADKDVAYGDVEKLIARVEKAKPPQISLATDRKDEDRPSEAREDEGVGR